MRAFVFKHLTAVTWIVWAVVAITLVAFSTSLRSERRNYRQQIAADEQAIQELSAAIARDKRAVQGIAHLQKSYFENDHALYSLMRQAPSPDQFPIHSGPRMAWCELPNSNEYTRRFAVYLPAGQHYLGYAMLDNYKQIKPHVEEAVASSAAVAHSLGSQGGVFEVIVHGNSPHVSCARSRELLFDRPVIGSDGPWRLHVELPANRIVFPSEWQPNRTSPFREGQLATHPVTELAIITATKVGARTTRLLYLWIESSAPPCVTTLTAAQHYETITGIDPLKRRDPEILNAPAREREFERLLEPNARSGRMYFRNNIFAPPRFVPREA